MTRIPCEIIRDLLPSYMDGLTSEESNQAVEEHLKECETCRAYFQAMKEAVASERYVEKSREEIKKEIHPLKKIERETRKRIVIAVIAVLLTVGILGTLYESLYGTGTQASAEDVKITASKTGDVVTIEFLPTNDSYYIEIWGGAYSADENGKKTYEWNKIQPVKWRTKPFETRNKTGAHWGFQFLDEDTTVDQNGETIQLTGEESLEIEFAGESKVVKIADLYTEEGRETLER